MLRGPTWSGSIQQDLIEKLWVAILTCDDDDISSSISHDVTKNKADDGFKDGVDNQRNESSSSSSSSSDDSDNDDSDIDEDLGAIGEGLPQVNRFDLFSVVKLKQNQENCTESQDVNGNISDTEKGNEDKVLKEDQEKIKLSDENKTAEEKPSKDVSRVSTNSSKEVGNISNSTGAKPKVLQSKSVQGPPQNRRPRPNTLNFAKPPRITNTCQGPASSRIGSVIKTRGQNATFSKSCKTRVLNGGSHTTKPGSSQEKKSPGGVPRQSPSRIPISPSRPSKIFASHDRANLLDVVPRRRIMSDPRPSRVDSGLRPSSNAWRRKAITPDADRPKSLPRTGVTRREPKNDDTATRQKQTAKGNVCRWNTGTSRKDTRPSSVFVSPSRKDDNRAPISFRRTSRVTGDKTGKPKIEASSDDPSSNSKKVNDEQLRKPASSTRTSRPFGMNIKSPNRDTQRASEISSFSKHKTTAKKVNTKSRESTQQANMTKPKSDAGVHMECNKTESDILHQNPEDADASHQKEEEKGEEENETTPEDTDVDLHETAVFNEVEVSRLENCLKEAIRGVLQELPEGWILVPEHTAELFSSLSSVVDSFPRPNHARARVLEAIVDAHARRPCGKGEIAVLNNSHLLLYIGLKLCSRCSGSKDPSQEDKSDSFKSESEDTKGKDTLRENPLKYDLAEDCPSVEHKGTVLKILGEILKCEGSFDRLMMCLLLGSRAPGRGSGWYCETEDENEKVQDLRYVLDHLKFVEGCRVSEVVSSPLWSCGSSPVVLAALAESPRLVLSLLQYGAGGGPANLYVYSRCYTNGVYLAIAYLVRKLESQFKKDPVEDGDPQEAEEERVEMAPEEGNAEEVRPAGEREQNYSNKQDLLKLAGPTPTALCLRYLLRAVPRVPIKFLRDQLGGCSRDCWQDVAYLLPQPCCLQPPSLLHLSRAACRLHFRSSDLLPQVVEELNIPETLRDYLNLLRD